MSKVDFTLITLAILVGLMIIIMEGCAIPIKLITYTSKEDINRLKTMELQRDKERKRSIMYIKINKLLNRKIREKRIMREERNVILRSFKESGTILKAFEKLGFSIFDLSGMFNEYGKSDMTGFCDYMAEQYPFSQWYRFELDRKILIPAKRNYNLLNRIKK